MKKLNSEILVKSDLDTVWKFFSNAQNLPKITPKKLSLKITSSSGQDVYSSIYPGQIITYTVKPFPLFKMEWMTEITEVKEGHHFIDEQRVGPYKIWHHQHFFKETSEGVLVIDEVHYCLPFYPFSEILGAQYVAYELKKIFDFREAAILNLEELNA